MGDLQRRQRRQPRSARLAAVASRNDRRSSREGAAADPQVAAEADSEPHRDDGSVPSRRSAWQRTDSPGFDRRLRAVDSRISVRNLAAPLLMTLALAACHRGAQQQNAAAGPAKNVPATAAGQGGVT